MLCIAHRTEEKTESESERERAINVRRREDKKMKQKKTFNGICFSLCVSKGSVFQNNLFSSFLKIHG